MGFCEAQAQKAVVRSIVYRMARKMKATVSQGWLWGLRKQRLWGPQSLETGVKAKPSGRAYTERIDWKEPTVPHPEPHEGVRSGEKRGHPKILLEPDTA